MNARTKQGFSLIELLVLIAVIGILLAIGALNLNNYIQQQRLNEAARTLGETLRQISHDAMNQSQEMVLAETINQSQLSWQDETAKTFQQSLPHNIKVSAQVPAGNITFTGRGFPVLGYSFTLSYNAKTRVVHLLPTGAVIYP
jgi:prepilin-type N-terminal cleavage/methylation domain-containing protein